MTDINIHEAKTHLSRYVKRALKGEKIVLCLRNKPVIQLTPVNATPKKRRPIGLYKGQFKVPDDFNDPLPDWLIDSLENGPVFPPPGEEMRLLLDTCTFLWIAEGSEELSARAIDVCTDPENSVYLSAVSAWEIAVKFGRGNLRLPARPTIFVPEARARLGVAPLPLSEEVAVLLERLPKHHRDPCDRLLVCQALHAELTIVTPDRKIRQYPAATEW